MMGHAFERRLIVPLLLASVGWGAVVALLFVLRLGAITPPLIALAPMVVTPAVSLAWLWLFARRGRRSFQVRRGALGWFVWLLSAFGWGAGCAFGCGLFLGVAGFDSWSDGVPGNGPVGGGPAGQVLVTLGQLGVLAMFFGTAVVPVIPLLSPLVVLSWERVVQRASPDPSEVVRS